MIDNEIPRAPWTIRGPGSRPESGGPDRLMGVRFRRFFGKIPKKNKAKNIGKNPVVFCLISENRPPRRPGAEPF